VIGISEQYNQLMFTYLQQKIQVASISTLLKSAHNLCLCTSGQY